MHILKLMLTLVKTILSASLDYPVDFFYHAPFKVFTWFNGLDECKNYGYKYLCRSYSCLVCHSKRKVGLTRYCCTMISICSYANDFDTFQSISYFRKTNWFDLNLGDPQLTAFPWSKCIDLISWATCIILILVIIAWIGWDLSVIWGSSTSTTSWM